MSTSDNQILLAIASMHERAARRARNSVRRLVHEECAMHLRALADDEAELVDALVSGIDKTEATAGDIV